MVVSAAFTTVTAPKGADIAAKAALQPPHIHLLPPQHHTTRNGGDLGEGAGGWGPGARPQAWGRGSTAGRDILSARPSNISDLRTISDLHNFIIFGHFRVVTARFLVKC